jgi:ATP-binding cassette subfamily B multidrug efflux pump
MQSTSSRSLLRFIIFHRWPARLLLLLMSLSASVFGLLSPFFQKAFIDSIMGAPLMRYLGLEVSPHALTNILLAFFAALIGQALNLSASYYGVREGYFIQKQLGDTLYQKMLSLRRDTMNKRSIGEVVSIYATDVASATTILEQTLPMGAAIIFPVILAPLFIRSLYDIPLAPIIVTMFVLILFHFLFSIRQSRFFFRFKQLAGERSGIVNEWIQNIRSLRILGWVTEFENKIFEKRIEETENRIEMVTNGQMNSSVASSVSFFINLSGMISMLYLGKRPVTPGEILALLWIFGVFLTRPFRSLPWVFTFGFDSYSSIKRVEAFLELGDDTESAQDSEIFKRPPFAHHEKSPSIEIRGLNLTLQNQKILSDINLDIAPGEFIAVVGEVGAGKSLLLYSMMREVNAKFEKFNIGDVNMLELGDDRSRDYFTFVSQDAFIMSSNLRENIVFEYGATAQNDEAVRSSLLSAQFDIERETLDDGLDTEIGERGVNLSGGQRQRISLARAIFFDRPIVLLDDSLSAVDVDTERELVRRLMLGDWKLRTRILVTHRLSVLTHVDRIIFLENGRISDIGKLSDLMIRSEGFRNFTASAKMTPLEVTEKDEAVDRLIGEAESLEIVLDSSRGGK